MSSIIPYLEHHTQKLGPPREAADRVKLEKFHRDGDVLAMVAYIKCYMQVDCTIVIGFVKSGGPKDSPAWILLPDPMPPYGTTRFRKLRLTIFIRKSFIADATLEQLTLAISHEIAHIVLDATGSDLKCIEPAVDALAMHLGFAEFYDRGVYTETRAEAFASHVPRWLYPLYRFLGILTWRISVSHVGYVPKKQVQEAAEWIRARR